MGTARKVSSLGQGAGGVAWGGVGVFLAVAFGGAWLVWSPTYFGVDAPEGLLAGASMVCVALATFVALRWVARPASIAAATALRPVRFTRYVVLAAFLLPALDLLAVGMGALAGVVQLDLSGFSGLRATLAQGTAGGPGVPWALILSTLGTAAVLFVVSLPLMFAEEWGWRGFLLPRLLPLGLWPALLGSGAIWGLWHLPGYLGPSGRELGSLPPFLVSAVLLGVLIGWLRLASGSLWPCVVAHGVVNTFVQTINLLFVDADYLGRGDVAYHLGLTGWPGWIAMLAAIAVLFRVRGNSSIPPDINPKGGSHGFGHGHG